MDTYTQAAFISTPGPCCVDLLRSTMTSRDTDAPADKQLRDTMPTYPVPPHSVADVSCIKTTRCTDLIAVVKNCHRDRKGENGRR